MSQNHFNLDGDSYAARAIFQRRAGHTQGLQPDPRLATAQNLSGKAPIRSPLPHGPLPGRKTFLWNSFPPRAICSFAAACISSMLTRKGNPNPLPPSPRRRAPEYVPGTPRRGPLAQSQGQDVESSPKPGAARAAAYFGCPLQDRTGNQKPRNGHHPFAPRRIPRQTATEWPIPHQVSPDSNTVPSFSARLKPGWKRMAAFVSRSYSWLKFTTAGRSFNRNMQLCL